VLCIGTGLHLIGDVIGVSEAWDHQFIHLVVLVALFVFFLAVRRGD
jgi:superfamily II helicase